MTLAEQTLAAVVAEVAGPSPAPGGGSIAALSGSMAASLVAMVCRLTAGKPAHADRDAETQAIMRAADELAHRLLVAVDEDTAAYLGVVAAYRRPKETAEEIATRKEAIQAAIRHAADVPLATASACLEVLELAARLREGFNANAASDLGVAVQMAAAGVRGAALNVAINAPSLADEGLAADLRDMAASVEGRAEQLAADLWQDLRARVVGASSA